jgi:hypothetical protein
MARRALLGTRNGLTQRTRVYLADDAIEVDEIEGYTGVRTRVLLDEVRVITIDRRRNAGTMVLLGLCAATIFLSTLLALSSNDSVSTGATFAAGLALCSPFLGLFLFHAIMGVDYVTVFGKRSNAAMSFTYRKAKARRTLELLREKISAAQDEARTRFAAEAAQNVPVPPGGFGTG